MIVEHKWIAPDCAALCDLQLLNSPACYFVLKDVLRHCVEESGYARMERFENVSGTKKRLSFVFLIVQLPIPKIPQNIWLQAQDYDENQLNGSWT